MDKPATALTGPVQRGLLSAAPRVAPFVCQLFYRLTISGVHVPEKGPVLLVANHPNSILDPFVVITAARRPVRFLAAAKLFEDPVMGRALSAGGAIPVYRQMDDPGQVEKNADTFRAAHAVLASGDAIALFPEGISLHEPAMAPVKTGAARIALGAALQCRGEFPVVPVGLVFEAKQAFRSRAHAAVGQPIRWGDLAQRGADDHDAVRELTRRVDEALHALTVNYEQWEDAPLIRAATEIYAAELGDRPEPARDVAWQSRSAVVLAALRRAGDPEAAGLARDVQRHLRLLRILGLKPHDVHRGTGVGSAAGWALRRLPAAIIPGLIVLVSIILFWPPYRITGLLARRHATGPTNLATRKVFYGVGIFSAWILVLALLAGIAFNWAAALVAFVLLPALVLETLAYLDPWFEGVRDVRSFLTRRVRADRIRELRGRQREIGRHLRLLRRRVRRSTHTAA